MKTTTAILLFVFFCFSGITAQELNQKKFDKNTDSEILIGFCNREGLTQGDFGAFFNEYYKTFKPDKTFTKKFKKQRDGLTVSVVMGSWCSDSKEQVPKFFKIADAMKLAEENIEIICIDSDGYAGDADVSELGILFIPTFIFYRNGKELGRIIETPSLTLESDMLMIMGD